jgi:hypothetical protein
MLYKIYTIPVLFVRGVLLFLWNFIANENNNRALTFLVLFVGTLFAYKEITEINLSLKSLSTDNIETNSISSPNDQLLLNELSDGNYGFTLDTEDDQTVLTLRSQDNKRDSCIGMKRANGELVHFLASEPGSVFTWVAGDCPRLETK